MVLALLGGICEMLCATTMSDSMNRQHHECSDDLCRICAATHGYSMVDASTSMTHAVLGALPAPVDVIAAPLEAPAPAVDPARVDSSVVVPDEQPPRV